LLTLGIQHGFEIMMFGCVAIACPAARLRRAVVQISVDQPRQHSQVGVAAQASRKQPPTYDQHVLVDPIAVRAFARTSKPHSPRASSLVLAITNIFALLNPLTLAFGFLYFCVDILVCVPRNEVLD
jgi:hypothetical protein